MLRYEVTLHIEVEAESAEDAFSIVRSGYAVVNDPSSLVKDGLVDFVVGDEPQELDEDETTGD